MTLMQRLRQHLQGRLAAKSGGTPYGHGGLHATWLHLAGPVWGARSFAHLAREGYAKNVVAHRSVRLVAECAAAVPLIARSEGVRLETHPLLDLLAAPNPLLCGQELLERVYAYLMLAGNVFLERVDGPEGTPAELHVLRPDRVSVVAGPDGWPEAYEFRLGERRRRFPVDAATGDSAILHLRTFHPLDDHYGLSALQAAAMGIEVHNAASGWNKALLDNAARPSGALVFEPGEGAPGNLTEEQVARLKAEMEEQFQGAANAGRPLLLEGGLKWQQMAFSPSDMDFIEAKHVVAREIALAFGVPPMLLGIPGDNTYANYQEANRAFWRLTLLPLVDKVLAGLGRWLGDAHGRPVRLVADRDAITALAPEREALYARLNAASFMTPNEKRAAVGLPSVEGGDSLAAPLFPPAGGGGLRPFDLRGHTARAQEAKAQAVRAARAARFAELTRALEAAREDGKTVKIWRTQSDGRVRESHRAMEGVRVPIDAPFEVAGEPLFLPCDSEGSFAETANCRCFVEFEKDTSLLPEFRGDRAFIEAEEGGLLTEATIPKRDGEIVGQSGVTIGAGVDLGQQSEEGLRRLGVDEAIIEKVRPFLGLRREAAERALAEQPLRLSAPEARELTDKVHNDIIRRVAANFDRDSAFRFFDLPPEAQTVIADVAIQFGAELGREDRTPKFWGFVTRGEWDKAIAELKDFGDNFGPRRNREAERLERVIKILNEEF